MYMGALSISKALKKNSTVTEVNLSNFDITFRQQSYWQFRNRSSRRYVKDQYNTNYLTLRYNI